MSQAKKPLDPADHTLNISKKKTSGQFIFLSKIFLNKFQEVHLHGLGEATKTVAAVAEQLQRKGYATLQKIETQTYAPPGSDQKGGKKVKLIAILKATEEGLKLIDEELQRKQKIQQEPLPVEKQEEKQQS